MKTYEEKLKNFNKLKAEKRDLQEELKRKKEKIKSLFKDDSRVKVMDLLKSKEKNEKKIFSLSLKIQKLKDENKLKELKLSTFKTKNERMKIDYDKISGENVKLKKDNSSIKKKIKTSFKNADEKSTHVTEFYKNKLKEKEREVQKLAKRVRRMILSDQRSNIVRRKNEMNGKREKIKEAETVEEKEKIIEELKIRNATLEKKYKDLIKVKNSLEKRRTSVSATKQSLKKTKLN